MADQEKLNKALIAAKKDDWDLANKILDGFGIEYVSLKDWELKYINLGDTYDLTICAEMNFPDAFNINQENDVPFISSWGDWYEQAEQDYCQETDTIRCGYCGEFTPMDKENWRDVICECCGNLVGG